MLKLRSLKILLAALLGATGCAQETHQQEMLETTQAQKVVVYQVFTRLFGNTNTTNKPWGTPEENGLGRFNDITNKALQEIRDLGVTHIWYTGVPHHALISDYTAYGISNDDPDVVKGRAGSPYAVKDYYNVNPDLAEDPARRLDEFKALVERTHRNGMKVLIDIVPNHIARRYEGKNNPEGVEDFGASDDTTVTYARDNNFYYNPGESFKVPEPLDGYKPLGGELHPLADGIFEETPAKWTGNGSRLSQPHFHDWYETVKINYGVRPDGTRDFDELPANFEQEGYKAHYKFWQDKQVPDSWKKFRDIALYWLDMGVDGFRFDMAEMVPVEFWSYMNSAIKMKNPDAFLLAEVYNPGLYRSYIQLGKMDYLYDKVELYDTLKHIMQGHGSTDHLAAIQRGHADIEHHMLHFLENHDEQRIASPEFAGSAEKGKPAMVVSATISTSPTLIYFGQEVGEPGAERGGFGSPTRTSIFDYVGVLHHQRWVNDKKYDGEQLRPEEKELRDFYKRLLNFTISSKALMGNYQDLHAHNRSHSEWYNDRLFSFARWADDERLLIVSNFSGNDSYSFDLKVPAELIKAWQLSDGAYTFSDQLYEKQSAKLEVVNAEGSMRVSLQPLESMIYKLE
jgi:glycosidase